jgi:hypothetical protein
MVGYLLLKKTVMSKKMFKLLLENLDMTVEEAFTTRQLEGFSKNSFETKVKEKQLTSNNK